MELRLCCAHLIRVQPPGFGDDWVALGFEGMFDLVLRRWGTFAVAVCGWESGKKGGCDGAECSGEF
jgi:hypothetical protein